MINPEKETEKKEEEEEVETIVLDELSPEEIQKM